MAESREDVEKIVTGFQKIARRDDKKAASSNIKAILYITVIIVIVLVIGVYVYMYKQKKSKAGKPGQTAKVVGTATPAATPSLVVPTSQPVQIVL